VLVYGTQQPVQSILSKRSFVALGSQPLDDRSVAVSHVDAALQRFHLIERAVPFDTELVEAVLGRRW
jgi:hypothetical protein